MCVILFCPSLHKRVLLQEECPEKGRCLVADVPQYFVPMLKNFSDSTLLNIFVLFQFVHLFVHFCNSFNSSFVYSLKGASLVLHCTAKYSGGVAFISLHCTRRIQWVLVPRPRPYFNTPCLCPMRELCRRQFVPAVPSPTRGAKQYRLREV